MPSSMAELKTDKGPASWHGTPAGSPRRLVASGGEGSRTSSTEPWAAGLVNGHPANESGAPEPAESVLAQDTVTQTYGDADRENR